MFRTLVFAALAALVASPLALVPSQAAARLPITVVATDFQFAPAAIVVPSGSTITWIAGTETFIPHTVTSPGNFDFRPGFVATGDTIASLTITAASGTILQYFCAPHAGLGMQGVIVVV